MHVQSNNLYPTFALCLFGLCHSEWVCVNTQSWHVWQTAYTSPLCSGFNFPLSPYSHLHQIWTSVVFTHDLSRWIKAKKARNRADITLWVWYHPQKPTHTRTNTKQFLPTGMDFPPSGLRVKSCVICLLAKHMAAKNECRFLPLQWLFHPQPHHSHTTGYLFSWGVHSPQSKWRLLELVYIWH